MLTDVSRPLPKRTPVNAPFWEHADRQILALPWCESCGKTHFPPSPRCPHCLHDAFDWRPASGRATLVSWVVFHRSYWDGVAADVPYNVCLVELDEGVRMLSNLVGAAEEAPRYKMPLKVTFTDRFPDLILPVFDAA
ncbi:OB-fold domain-containing protein [Acuticoccus sp. M5D2P5]|uniref:Zn-ribbon domain-containing OB-fold protein n=1 Tax=Acuticoccus kalidii TaxID=2910977 RepID=UPI001F43ECEB|nr:OB-fold domain-containing protein [Acuticoccus kalidii]MCF3935329.1 OB-fold domain-containing protein [Acuticoccus kalidii]